MKEETRDPGAIKYHYNRDERTASLPDRVRERSERTGILRGNRSLLITLLDVAFLVALVVVFSVVSRLMGDSSLLPGYTVSARASAFGDRVLVSVTVEALEEREGPEAVRIRIGYPDGRALIELNDFLPADKKAEQIYRGSLPFDAGNSEVKITLLTGSNAGSLTTKIREE